MGLFVSQPDIGSPTGTTVRQRIGKMLRAIILSDAPQASAVLRHQLPGAERDLRKTLRPLRTNPVPVTRYPMTMTIDIGSVTLENAAGQVVSLAEARAAALMLLIPSDGLLLLPGLAQRIAQRRAALPQHFRLIVVTDHPCDALPDALIDRERRIRQLVGYANSPLLISVDPNGSIFDVVHENETIHDWLWNEPRPRSLRVHGAVGLNDVKM